MNVALRRTIKSFIYMLPAGGQCPHTAVNHIFYQIVVSCSSIKQKNEK
jgi:hypothetical protein